MAARKRETSSTREVAVEGDPMSKASRQLDCGCRAVKGVWGGSTDSEHIMLD